MRRSILCWCAFVAVITGCYQPAETLVSDGRTPRGFLYGRMAGIPPDVFVQLSDADRRRLEYYGCTFKRQADGTVTWEFPIPDRRLTILFDSLVAGLPAIDAGFELPEPSVKLQRRRPSLRFNGQALANPPPLELKTYPNGTVKVEWQFHFDAAGCVHHRPKGAPEIEGSCTNCGACVDNNGFYDYWGCRTSRWLGFPGSDCNAAYVFVGRCNLVNDAYCDGTRNCSPLIGHPRCWHGW